MRRLVIDPVTRIEGHLRIEVELENGKVKDAWSSGTLFRGFEIILKGRDPRDAWFITQRICGVCPVPHGLTSVFALEDAFPVQPPNIARIVRNLIEGTQMLHSHILWFYHLNGLDYVDILHTGYHNQAAVYKTGTGNLSLRHCLLKNSSEAGLRLSAGSGLFTTENNAFENNRYGVRLNPDTSFSDTTSTFSGNTYAPVAVNGGSHRETVTWELSSAYAIVVMDDITIVCLRT